MELVPDSLLAVAAILYVAIFTVLIRRYVSARDVGLVWLGAAVVVWPIASLLLDLWGRTGMNSVAKGQPVAFPFSLVEQGRLTMGGLTMSLDLSRQVVGLSLLLVAVLYLHRSNGMNQQPQATGRS